MHEKNQPENECELDNPLDKEWDTLNEDDAGGDRQNHPIFKIAVVIILMAFIALSYAWLPSTWTTNFDFLKQDKALSEDEIVRRCKPAVVNIKSTRTGKTAAIQGTGFNLEPSGMIVTNRHVVEGASTVEVTFSDDKRLFSQDINLIDGYDLAVIWFKGNDLPSLPVSDRIVEIGESVTIIGNPRGFQGVSCRGKVREYYKTDSGMLVFTIDAAIAPGSSGSPVLDAQGCLVGIIYAAGKIAVDGEEQNRAIAIPATALFHLSMDHKDQKYESPEQLSGSQKQND